MARRPAPPDPGLRDRTGGRVHPPPPPEAPAQVQPERHRLLTAGLPFRALLAAALLAGPAACRTAPSESDLDVPAAAALVEARKGDPAFVILDVRTPAEHAAGRIPGAVLLDYNAPGFQDGLGKLDRSKTYLVHCAAGGRSAKALSLMKAAGFSRAYNMLGGMNAWSAQGLPVEK